jgi:hypothetical protein
MEPYVVELSDGRLLMFMRTQMDCQYQSVSTDEGVHWTDAVPGPLVSPESPAAARRIPGSGKILIVWNRATREAPAVDRTPLNAALSSDDCGSWHDEVVLEDSPGRTFSYPGVHVLGDAATADVFVTYYDRDNARISLAICRLGL